MQSNEYDCFLTVSVGYSEIKELLCLQLSFGVIFLEKELSELTIDSHFILDGKEKGFLKVFANVSSHFVTGQMKLAEEHKGTLLAELHLIHFYPLPLP